ncbi:hypothetical protein NNX39_09380 [Arthrobacter sp. zg-Y826]|uniref:hypothetical protein n=1 Tax=Arthrobacter jinronghuae TaxID=2964609 RepID=UPI002104C94A|nr:hypothetical protein [Arthrobacter jinronghuae]MCQ1956712.1 hypothetical protein [Arthrobacter jinronghuae]
MAEQGDRPGQGPFVPPQQSYPYQQQPYPQQFSPQTPYGHPAKARSGAEFAALMTASVLTVFVGAYTTLVAFVVFINLGMTQGASDESGERAKYEVMALLLCPGPFVALGLAWGGYAVLRRLKHPTAARWWFGAALLIWFMLFLFWLGPEVAFPMTDSV